MSGRGVGRGGGSGGSGGPGRRRARTSALGIPQAMIPIAMLCAALLAGVGHANGATSGDSAAGAAVAYTGYEGTAGDDKLVGLGSDLNGNLYLAMQGGDGTDHPAAACPAAQRCVTILKLSPTGKVLGGAALIGGPEEGAPGDGPVPFTPVFAVGPDGTVAIALPARTTHWPLRDASAVTLAGGVDTYVAVLDSDLQSLVRTSFVGTADDDVPRAIAIDRNHVVVAGITAPLDPQSSPVTGSKGASARPTLSSPQAFLATLTGPTGAPTLLTVSDNVTEVQGLAVLRGQAAVLFSGTTTRWVQPVSAAAGWGTGGRLAVVDLDRGATRMMSPIPAGTNGQASAVAYRADGMLVVGRDHPPQAARPTNAEGKVAGSIELTAIDTRAAHVLWQTWLGGSATDILTSLAPRANGDMVASGIASSSDFLPGPDQAGVQGPSDTFTATVSAVGQPADRSLLGGSGAEGRAQVTPLWDCATATAAETASPDLAALLGRKTQPLGGRDSFLAIRADAQAPCNALAGVGGSAGCPNDPLSLSIDSLPGLGAPHNVTWRLGDGSLAYGTSVLHAYHGGALVDVQVEAQDPQDRHWSLATVVHPCLGTLGPEGTSHLVAVRAAAAPPERVADSDHDGVADWADNCPRDPNHTQADIDADGLGDACDSNQATPPAKITGGGATPVGTAGLAEDQDRDGIADTADNCVTTPNRDQKDGDLDSVGDACDLDLDNDGVNDRAVSLDAAAILDNCALLANPDQANQDADALGDVCDPRPCTAGQDAATTTAQPSPSCPLLMVRADTHANPLMSGRDLPSTAILWVAGAAVVMAGGAALAYRRWGRLLPFGLLGFSRILPDKILENPARRRLVELVSAEPGMHPQALVRSLGMGRGTVEHHLRLLEKAGHIRGKKVGGRVCYFATGQVDVRVQPATVTLRPVLARSMLAEVIRSPGLSLTDLATHLGCSYGAVLYHADRLEDAQLVRRERHAGLVHLVPLPLGEQALGVLGVSMRTEIAASTESEIPIDASGK